MIGRTIHGYEIKERIGSGGFGEVYRAYQPLVDREVAVKVILPEHVQHPDFVLRFETEARTIARLEHPHIVPLYDFWQGSEGAFISMRYLRGGSLRSKLEREGSLELSEVQRILNHICSALETAHEQNVVHRDLKPENILLDERGEAYLTDFGIAKDLSADYRTQTGSLMGSLAYIAPEQALGDPVSAAADIYTLGIVIYELLTGQHPFANLTPVQMLQQHLNAPLPSLAEARPDLPPSYDELIRQATVKDPNQRKITAAEIAQKFRQAEEVDSSPRPAILPEFLKEDLPEAPAAQELFIGRRRELAQLEKTLDRALSGTGQLAFVTGGPGRGKTRLVSEFALRARQSHQDLIVVWGSANAFSGVGDPYLPFREVLGMLSGDIEDKWAASQLSTDHARALWDTLPATASALIENGPDLVDVFVDGQELVQNVTRVGVSANQIEAVKKLAQRPALDGKNIQQAQLFEQYTNVLRRLAEQRPILLMLDDLQWADGASISLLLHLGHRLDNARILILCTYRGEEVALGRNGDRHPLERVLTEFRRLFGEISIDLSQEKVAEGRQFVDELLDSEANKLGESFRDALFNKTGGHALFTLELLRSMQEAGDLLVDEDNAWIEGPHLDWERLPVRVEAVIEERISRLEDELRDLLTVASVEGENFTVEVISEVQDIQYRSLLRKLSQQLEKRHHLVQERGDARAGSRILSQYRFSHQLFQHYLYGELSAAERRLLHLEVARTLEHLYEDDLDKITIQLARHFQEAGDNERARPYIIRAGQLSKRLFANKEALNHFDQALKLTPEQNETYFEILRERAGVLNYLFNGQDAVVDYEELLVYGRESADQHLELDALIGLGRGNYIISIDHPAGGAAHKSERYYSEAFELARVLGDSRGMVLALVPTVWFEDFWPEYAQTARKNAQKALEISLDDGDEMLIIESELAMFYTDRLAHRGERGARLLEKLEAIGNLERLNYLHFGLMFSSLYFGEFEESVDYCDKGIALARRIGAPPVQYPSIKATALINLGRLGQARASLQDEIADEDHLLGKAFKELVTGFLHYHLLDYRRSAEILESALSQAEQLSRAWMQSAIHSYLLTCAVEGELADEIDVARSVQYLQGTGPHKAKVQNPSAAAALGWMALAAGDVEAAEAEIERAKSYAQETSRRPGTVLALDLEAELRLRQGDYDKALASASEGLKLAEPMHYRPLIWRLMDKRLRVYQQGRSDELAQQERRLAWAVISEMADNIWDEDERTAFLASPTLAGLIVVQDAGE